LIGRIRDGLVFVGDEIAFLAGGGNIRMDMIEYSSGEGYTLEED
jgi:hypothetical protein